MFSLRSFFTTTRKISQLGNSVLSSLRIRTFSTVDSVEWGTTQGLRFLSLQTAIHTLNSSCFQYYSQATPDCFEKQAFLIIWEEFKTLYPLIFCGFERITNTLQYHHSMRDIRKINTFSEFAGFNKTYLTFEVVDEFKYISVNILTHMRQQIDDM